MSRPSLPSTTIPCGGVNGHSPNRCDPTAFPKLAALFGFHSSGSGDGHRRRTGRRQRCSAIFSGSESSSSGPDSLTLPTDAVLLVPRVTSVTWHLQDRTVPPLNTPAIRAIRWRHKRPDARERTQEHEAHDQQLQGVGGRRLLQNSKP